MDNFKEVENAEDKIARKHHFLISFFWIVIFILICIEASTTEKEEIETEIVYNQPTIEQLERAILWTVTPSETTKEETILIYSGARASKDKEYRIELATAFIEAGKKYNISAGILTSIAYWESVYKQRAEGDGGRSLGMMQTGRQARNACRCNMNTIAGQVDCGACWLDRGRSWCGSLKGGLSAYACGRCRFANVKTKYAVKVRVRLAKIMREKFWKD